MYLSLKFPPNYVNILCEIIYDHSQSMEMSCRATSDLMSLIETNLPAENMLTTSMIGLELIL